LLVQLQPLSNFAVTLVVRVKPVNDARQD